MMGGWEDGRMIPQESIALVLEHAEILGVVQSYPSMGQLQQRGKNYFGLCPFHDDRRPSLVVNPDRNIFKCFACGVGGTAAGFVMHMEGVSFPQAVEKLAMLQGVSLSGVAEETRRIHYRKNEMYAVNEAAARVFVDCMSRAAAGRGAESYLINRGFTEKDLLEYKIGYAPEGWHTMEENLSGRFSQEILLEAGLLSQSDNGRVFDRFRQRIMFPIFDERGRVAGFVGRYLGDGVEGVDGGERGEGGEKGENAKYLNSPETLVYQKGRILYGLHRSQTSLRRTGEVIIVEGYIDQIALDRVGIANNVGLGGIALTQEHALLLQRSGVKNAYLCFDKDAAGVEAAVKSGLMLLRAGINPNVMSLPEGEDPDDFLRKHSKEDFLDLAARAQSLLEFKISSLDFDVRVKKYEALLACLPILAGVPDVIMRGSSIHALEDLLDLPGVYIVGGLEGYVRKKAITVDVLPLLSSPQGELECELLGVYLRWPLLRKSIREMFPLSLFSHAMVKDIAGWVYEHIDGEENLSHAVRAFSSEQIDLFHPQELSRVVEGVVRGVVGDDEALLLLMHRMFSTQRFENPGHEILAWIQGELKRERRESEIAKVQEELLLADAERNIDNVRALLQRYVGLTEE